MTIDWINFTPWTSLGGGILIGLAAAVLLIFNGRIAGISGILGGLLRPLRGDIAWRIAFVAGVLVSPFVFRLPVAQVDAGYALLVVAGLLVGVGTRYGSGCTSGHGICGLSRGSARSVAATCAFMLAGFAVVYVVRHVMG